MQKASHVQIHVLKIIARQQEQQREQVAGKSSTNQSLPWQDSEEGKKEKELGKKGKPHSNNTSHHIGCIRGADS